MRKQLVFVALLMIGLLSLGAWQNPITPVTPGPIQDYLDRHPGGKAADMNSSYVISPPGAFRRTGIAANVGPVTLVPTAGPFAMTTSTYVCVYGYAATQTVGTGATTASLTFAYNDGISAGSVTTATWSLAATTTAGKLAIAPICFQAAANTAITVSLTGTFGSPASTTAAEAFVEFKRG